MKPVAAPWGYHHQDGLTVADKAEAVRRRGLLRAWVNRRRKWEADHPGIGPYTRPSATEPFLP